MLVDITGRRCTLGGEENPVVAIADAEADEPSNARDLAELAGALRGRSQRLLPRIGALGTACAYVRRRALQAVDPLDDTLDLAAALDDLSLRISDAGLLHVL